MADFKIIDSQPSNEALDSIISKTDELAVAWKDRLYPAVKAVTTEMAKGTPKEYSEAIKKAVEASKALAEMQKKLVDVQVRLEQIEQKIAKTRQISANETEKARIKEIQLQQDREKAVDRFNSLEKKEQQRIANAASLYYKLEQKLKSLQLEYRDLASAKELGLKITDQEAKRYDYLKNKIERYDTTLKAVDASMGKHQRNVGDYARANNGLGMSLAQITREMPAFANSVSTGFMALSNNIPIFFDAIGKVKNLNKELQAQGKPTVSVLKQLAGAFFSWQTLLSVAVTLLTVYGADIVKWGQNMIFGATAIKNANDLMKDSANITKQMNEQYADSLSLYMRLRYQWLSSSGDLKERNKFLRESKDEFSKLGVEINSISEAESFLVKNTANVVKALNLRARAAAFQDIAKQEQLKAIEEQKKVEEDIKAVEKGGFLATLRVIMNPTLYGRGGKLAGKKNEFNAALASQEASKLEAEASTLLRPFEPTYKKDKPYKGSQLTGEQKDYLMDLETRRKNEITAQDKLLYDKKIKEEDYWKEYKAITIKYRDAVDAYLNDKNAKERKIDADTKARALQALKEANGKLYDIDKADLDNQFKVKEKVLEDELKAEKDNLYLSEVQKIEAQSSTYNKLIDLYDNYYKSLIATASKYNIPTIGIETERGVKMKGVQSAKAGVQAKAPVAAKSDLEYTRNIEKLAREAGQEEGKRLILSDKKLSNSQKEYMLSMLDLDIKQTNLLNDKETYNIRQAELLAKYLSVGLTRDEKTEWAEISKKIGEVKNGITDVNKSKKQLEANKVFNDLKSVRDIIGEGFQGLGLGELSDEFDTLFKSILDKAMGASDNFKEIWKDGLNLVGEYAKILVEQQTQKHIQELDKQLEYSKNATEQELGFIDKRLEYYSNMQDLTAEQIADRNALEDEARAYREQQEEREKLIAIQKAKAEQRASANKAIIGGLQGAATSIANLGLPEGLPFAIASTAMGALMAALIMSKNPVPQYFVGRSGGRAEFALTQERGAEAIVDKKGNVKTWGNDSGAQLTWLDEGDSVLTAPETMKLKRNQEALPELDFNFYRSNALKNIGAPIILKNTDNSDAIAEKVGNRFDSIMRKYDKEHIFELNGVIYSQKGGQIPIMVGKAKKNKIEIKVNKNGRD